MRRAHRRRRSVAWGIVGNTGESSMKRRGFLQLSTIGGVATMLAPRVFAAANGAAAWRVAIYPSSFVVAPDGRIKAQAAGALHWNDPDVAERVAGPAAARR
jgi:hypothetical protein